MDNRSRCPECGKAGEVTEFREDDLALEGDFNDEDPVYGCPCGALWQWPAEDLEACGVVIPFWPRPVPQNYEMPCYLEAAA